MSKGVEEYEPGHSGDISGYTPAANASQNEEYNPEEGINEDEVPAYKPSLAFIEQNYVSCVTSDEKPNPDSGYDNAKEDSSDSDSGLITMLHNLCDIQVKAYL